MVTETHVAPSSEKETEIWTHQLKKSCEQFVTGHAMRQQPRWKSVQPRNPFDPAFGTNNLFSSETRRHISGRSRQISIGYTI
jgi:hypothetical protein